MTVVVWDGTTMAADSMVCQGNTRVQNTRKIHKIGDALVGTAGYQEDGILFRDWLAAGCPKDEKPQLADTFWALVVTKRGAYEYFDKLVPIKVKAPTAIGSGHIEALAALKAGADARRAVKITCAMNPFCAPPIVCKKL